jgi:hypothetical protein
VIRPQYTHEKLDREMIKLPVDMLEERLARVCPLILREGRLYDFTIAGLNEHYTYDPAGMVEVPDERDYFEVTRTATQHSCGHHVFFKPSIAEVLAQLPPDPNITAFYLDTATVVVLDQGEGHLCTCHWLTDKSIPRARR